MKQFFLWLIVLSYPLCCIAGRQYIWLQAEDSSVGGFTAEAYQQLLTPNNGHVLFYNSELPISSAAKRLYENHLKNRQDNHEIIVIGHGLGGLIARSLQSLSKSIRGIITICTPHNGSVLFANVLNAKSYNYFKHLIAKINSALCESGKFTELRGPFSNVLSGPLEQIQQQFKQLLSESCILASNKAYQNSIESFALNQISHHELLPQSNFIKKINEISQDVPLINIYGSEDPWQTVRLTRSYHNSKDKQHKQLSQPEFDEHDVKEICRTMATVRGMQHLYQNIYNALAIPAVFHPQLWFTRESLLKTRYQWDDIYRYFEVDIHADFASAMGAIDYRLRNYCRPTGVNTKELICENKYLPYITENDGILSVRDVTFKGRSNSSVFTLRAQGVNFNEISNHWVMKRILHQIIRENAYGKVFSY